MPPKHGAGFQDPIIVDDSETEDEDEALKRGGGGEDISGPTQNEVRHGTAAGGSVGGLSLLVRAQLETERKERAAKRAMEEAGPSQPPAQRSRITGPSRDGASVHSLTDAGQPRRSLANESGMHKHTVSSCLERIQSRDRFWDGTVRRSYNHYATPAPDGMRFEDMLLPTTANDSAGCTHILFSSFCADPTWLPTLVPSGSRAPHVTLVDDMQKASTAEIKRLWPASWTYVAPKRPREGAWGVQHVKIVMLKYPDRLRICILTGNLIEYDWYQVENLAYVQDFRRLPEGQEAVSRASDAFKQLATLFDSWDMKSQEHPCVKALEQYDLSAFGGGSGARLCASFPEPGLASVWGWKSIETRGLGRLKRIIDDLKITPRRGGMQLLTQGSSLGGRSNVLWLHHLHLIASGLGRLVPLPAGTSQVKGAHKSALSSAAIPEACDTGEVVDFGDWPPVRIQFPTLAQVDEAPGGRSSAGTFFAKTAEIDKNRQVMHQPASQRGKILMHLKIIFALQPGVTWEPSPSPSRKGQSASSSWSSTGRTLGGSSSASTGSEAVCMPLDAESAREQAKQRVLEKRRKAEFVGWLYMGSANLTAAAWGHISKPKDAGSPTMTGLLNHELGIVFPISREDLSADHPSFARDALAFHHKPKPYGPADKVWDQQKFGVGP
ncbi:Tyrosyl-DNA phosphodiesterase [Ceraceosorus bombacis]|uniref:Tyrosyl-DNA phosphodiesterase n=1 Tax=Ceraceosorus bombacis TaxID=401625 RepID=A0A0P1BMQ6_9BASI|nr:Tyrosyl-DNA phosphodiesterase [Ceraceosorus bombacis]